MRLLSARVVRAGMQLLGWRFSYCCRWACFTAGARRARDLFVCRVHAQVADGCDGHQSLWGTYTETCAMAAATGPVTALSRGVGYRSKRMQALGHWSRPWAFSAARIVFRPGVISSGDR